MTKEDSHLIAVPPDGGWGWIVVLVICYGAASGDAASMAFQVIRNDLMDLVEMDAPTTSFILSTYISARFLVGPLAAGICNKYGFRATTLIGAFLMVVGFMMAYFFSQFSLLILFFGLIAGGGSSLTYMVCSVAPGFWFEKKRTIALGLTTAASGGSVVFVPLSKLVADHYGWRSCILLWAFLQVIVGILAFLLRPPPMILVTVGETNTAPTYSVSTLISLHTMPTTTELSGKKIQAMTGSSALKTVHSGVSTVKHDGCCAKWHRCLNVCTENFEEGVFRPLHRKDIFYKGDINYVATKEEIEPDKYLFKVQKLPGPSTAQDIQMKSKTQLFFIRMRSMLEPVAEMFDMSLFKLGVFWLLFTSAFVTYTATYIPFHIVKRANAGKMNDKYIGFLSTIMGMGLSLVRIILGLGLYFFPKIGPLRVVIFGTVTGGICLCLIPLTHDLIYQITISFLSGFLTGVIVPFRSVIIIEVLGLDRLTSCTGNLFFIQGIACFIAMPITEYLIAKTNSIYSGLFFAGSLYIANGVLFGGVLMITKSQKRTK